MQEKITSELQQKIQRKEEKMGEIAHVERTDEVNRSLLFLFPLDLLWFCFCYEKNWKETDDGFRGYAISKYLCFKENNTSEYEEIVF